MQRGDVKTFFDGRLAALGTMHEKERVIVPVLNPLGLRIVVPENFNSDVYGTFTLDVPRTISQLEAARAKARAAMELVGAAIGIASEGSFGAHPDMPFATVNTEIVLLIDTELEIEVYGGSSVPAAYARQARISQTAHIEPFLQSINFPKQCVVIRPDENNYVGMVKGLGSIDQVMEVAAEMLKKHGQLWIETDYRAHANTERRKNIQKATKDLLEQLHVFCPSCNKPGFMKTGTVPGLPCELCSRPTSQARAVIRTCSACGHTGEEPIVSLSHAYAGLCDFCNP